MIFVDWMEARYVVEKMCEKISTNSTHRYTSIHAVPIGGVYPATIFQERTGLPMVGKDEVKAVNTIVFDDVIGTGKTRRMFATCDFACMYDKSNFSWEEKAYPLTVSGREVYTGEWLTFPWESLDEEKGPDDAVRRLIEYTGDDPNREGLEETPARVISAINELCQGYSENPEGLMKTFPSDGYRQMVVIKDIEFFSLCEHHLMPFFGKAHIAYIPKNRVVGASKLARLLNIFCRRLQIQERVGEQITDNLMSHLAPEGAACMIEAQHSCMQARGVSKQNSQMVTTSLKGSFLEDQKVREEFLGYVT